MEITEFKKIFKKKFSKNLEFTIRSLEEVISYESEKYDDLVLIKSRIKKLNENLDRNLVSNGDYNIELEKIKKAILSIINSIEVGDLVNDESLKKTLNSEGSMNFSGNPLNISDLLLKSLIVLLLVIFVINFCQYKRQQRSFNEFDLVQRKKNAAIDLAKLWDTNIDNDARKVLLAFSKWNNQVMGNNSIDRDIWLTIICKGQESDTKSIPPGYKLSDSTRDFFEELNIEIQGNMPKLKDVEFIRTSLTRIMNTLEIVCVAYDHESADREMINDFFKESIKLYFEDLSPYFYRYRAVKSPKAWEPLQDLLKEGDWK